MLSLGLHVPPPLAFWLGGWSAITSAPHPAPRPSDELWLVTSSLTFPAAPGDPEPHRGLQDGSLQMPAGPSGLGTALWAHILTQESRSLC